MDAKIEAYLKDLYNSNKIIFYTVVPLLGLALLAIKFRHILISLIVGDSKSVLKDAQDTDAGLAQKADAAKQAADDAVKQGDQEASKEAPIDDDWNKQ